MDAKDFRLLVALDENARQSFQALGRKVALTAPAVRDRLHRLEERGILHGYWVSINPAVFGRKDLLVSFGGEWSRDEAIRALGGPDVAWVAWKVDGGVTVEVWPYDAEKAVPALERFLGHRAIWQGVSRAPLKRELSGLDWRVLDALIDDPRAPIEVLSVATGLSPKTARNHVTRLIRDEAIYVVPRLGFLADSGEIVYHLVVAGTASFAELRRAIGDAVLPRRIDREDPCPPNASECVLRPAVPESGVHRGDGLRPSSGPGRDEAIREGPAAGVRIHSHSAFR